MRVGALLEATGTKPSVTKPGRFSGQWVRATARIGRGQGSASFMTRAFYTFGVIRPMTARPGSTISTIAGTPVLSSSFQRQLEAHGTARPQDRRARRVNGTDQANLDATPAQQRWAPFGSIRP